MKGRGRQGAESEGGQNRGISVRVEASRAGQGLLSVNLGWAPLLDSLHVLRFGFQI